MILRVIGHNFHYEMENLCRVFFPDEKIKTVYNKNEGNEDKIVTTIFIKKEQTVNLTVEVQLGNAVNMCSCAVDINHNNLLAECERQMAVALFDSMVYLTGYIPSWGILTGVRPSKLMINLIKQCGEEGAASYFRNDLLVSSEKTNLAITVANAEAGIISRARKNCFSLYVSIPFCPSRCSYCSFVSHSITAVNARKLLPEYIENLFFELKKIGKIASMLGINPQTIYFGGGTPTSLEATDLERICKAIGKNFNLSYLDEYTVEAGRPDTITKEKLTTLKNNGVTRISINPQTFNDDVLEAIGRKHTSECTLKAYNLARLVGFESINMDLIAGLPKDSLEGFSNTLEISRNLAPENITVHTLALKRSSSLVTQGEKIFDCGKTAEMLNLAQNKLPISGYHPYYMYRQSRSVGNLENIGWCKPGYEGIYNVFMMEECQTVLSAGAGAVTKLKEKNGSHIERIFNFKYPYEYNSRFSELIERKKAISEFFSKYNV